MVIWSNCYDLHRPDYKYTVVIVVNIAVLCIIGVKLSRIPADEMLLNTAR